MLNAALGGVGCTALAELPGHLVPQAWLRAHLDHPRVRIVDCRFALDDAAAGSRRYRESHIAGAARLDLDRDLSGPPGAAGRHPLPDAEELADAVRRAGISHDSLVVAYDEQMTGGAARLWWLLRHHGHQAVGVLDGGFGAWRGPTRAGPEDIEEGTFTARSAGGGIVTRQEILRGLGEGDRVLVDARAPDRFRGEVEPIDPVAGHIPGALNLPHAAAFPAPDDLVAADQEVVAYCGSGVTACVVLLALADAGREDAKLYPGSWSEWVAHDLPVELGAAGSGEGS